MSPDGTLEDHMEERRGGRIWQERGIDKRQFVVGVMPARTREGGEGRREEGEARGNLTIRKEENRDSFSLFSLFFVSKSARIILVDFDIAIFQDLLLRRVINLFISKLVMVENCAQDHQGYSFPPILFPSSFSFRTEFVVSYSGLDAF